MGDIRSDKMMKNASGNAVLLVLTDSRGAYWDRFIVKQTVLDSLGHFGMPCRHRDMAQGPLLPQELDNCACVVIAQNRIGGSIGENGAKLISEAVKRGIGLVNFDNDIRIYDGAYLEIFGFERINPNPFASDLFRIRQNDHYITGMQADGEWHRFDRMVTTVGAERWRSDVTVLGESILGKDQLVYTRHITPWSAFEPKNYPSVFAAEWGIGRAVQFTVNPRVWKKEFFGHARGIDDLFWRSIVWCARKPFAMNIIPPFASLSFDDCSGRHDFRYAKIAAEHGFISMPALFIDLVPERLYSVIREEITGGKIEFTDHAFDYYNHFYHRFGVGEYTDSELKENFSRVDDFWNRAGVKPGPTVRPHLGEFGVKALPYLKARGRVYINPPLQPGLLKADMCMNDGYGPYDLQNCYYDTLPDEPEFFVYNSMMPRFNEDFLTGCTVTLKESDKNDLQKAASNLAGHLLHGLRGGFYAEAVTHEQKFEGLSMQEWDKILDLAKNQMKKIEYIPAGHDYIGRYLKGKYGSCISDANAEGDQIDIKMDGNSDTELMVSIFRDIEESVEREYIKVPAFS